MKFACLLKLLLRLLDCTLFNFLSYYLGWAACRARADSSPKKRSGYLKDLFLPFP